MASAIKIESTETLVIGCASSNVEGDIVVNNVLAVVAMTNALLNGSNYFVTGKLPCRMSVISKPVQALSTDGSAGSGSAVALGDKLYRGSSGQEINKDSSGKFIGYALGIQDSVTGGYAQGQQIASGSTATIDILLVPFGS